MKTRFLHKGIARYHNTALIPILNSNKLDTYLKTVDEVVSQMKGLLELRIVIRTIDLEEWTNHKYRLFMSLRNIESMQVTERFITRLDIVQMRWKDHLGAQVDNEGTILEVRAGWKIDNNVPYWTPEQDGE
jgi:hypothetical protein